MRVMRNGSRSSCKKRIWLRRNSRSDSSSTENDLASSTALRRETVLMVMWSRIFGIGRVSSVEGSGQASPMAGTGTVGGGGSTSMIGLGGGWGEARPVATVAHPEGTRLIGPAAQPMGVGKAALRHGGSSVATRAGSAGSGRTQWRCRTRQGATGGRQRCRPIAAKQT
jgi:hypothetical protein